MFNSSSYPEKTSNDAISNQDAVPILICLLAAASWFGLKKNLPRLEVFYFNHFEEIYLALFFCITLICAFLVYLIRSKTVNFTDRVNLLSWFWNNSTKSIFIGKTQDGCELYLPDNKRTSHVQIIGTTGRGKTQSVVLPWVYRDLARSKSVILIDGKGDREIIEDLSIRASKSTLKVNIINFDLNDSKLNYCYNPLKNGSPQQIVDRIFSSFEFDDSFYRSVQYDICGYLIRLIQETNNTVSFKLLYMILTDDNELARLLKLLPEASETKKFFRSHLKDSRNDRKKNLAGLISQLSPFAVGELSHLFNGDKSTVSILDVLINESETPTLLYFGIPTLKYQKIGFQLGKLLLQDLAYCIGEKESHEDKKFCSVFLDEFSEFVYEGFTSILNKARSANVGLHLSHQAISDLTKVSESFANCVNTNTNIKCILGLNDPETADFYARHIGTKAIDKLTTQMSEEGLLGGLEETGMASKRGVEAYKIHPNELKSLYHGKGVIHFASEHGVLTETLDFAPL